MQKNNYCVGFYGNAGTIKWAQFFLLAQIPPLASSGCMPDIRVGAKHWQLIACSTDQLSVLNNLPILLGAPEKPPLASWKLPPFEQPLLQEVPFPSTRGGGGNFLKLHMKCLLKRWIIKPLTTGLIALIEHQVPPPPSLLLKPGLLRTHGRAERHT